PATYIFASEFMGLTPDGWITLLTVIYLLIQISTTAPKMIKTYSPWFAKQYLALTLLIKSMRKGDKNE
ncbi:MAG: hypothetical protein EOM46_22955, partial [Gammaproteobacteria bacterium]|nr:hypothetical protein [Gammaproteobacteria bacterium]